MQTNNIDIIMRATEKWDMERVFKAFLSGFSVTLDNKFVLLTYDDINL